MITLDYGFLKSFLFEDREIDSMYVNPLINRGFIVGLDKSPPSIKYVTTETTLHLPYIRRAPYCSPHSFDTWEEARELKLIEQEQQKTFDCVVHFSPCQKLVRHLVRCDLGELFFYTGSTLFRLKTSSTFYTFNFTDCVCTWLLGKDFMARRTPQRINHTSTIGFQHCLLRLTRAVGDTSVFEVVTNYLNDNPE